MVRRLNVRVDHDVCVGNAMCRVVAGNVFVSTQTVNPSSQTQRPNRSRGSWRQPRIAPSARSAWKTQRPTSNSSSNGRRRRDGLKRRSRESRASRDSQHGSVSEPARACGADATDKAVQGDKQEDPMVSVVDGGNKINL